MASVDAAGVAKLGGGLHQIATGLADLSSPAAADLLAAAVAQRAPRRTGRLAGSVAVDPKPVAGTIASVVVKADYAGVIQWGWPARHIKANEFATDAIDELTTQLLDLTADAAQQLIDNAL